MKIVVELDLRIIVCMATMFQLFADEHGEIDESEELICTMLYSYLDNLLVEAQVPDDDIRAAFEEMKATSDEYRKMDTN